MKRIKRTPKYIWMQVSNDKYELPLYVADTSQELADILGVPVTNITSAMSHARQRGTNCRYIKIKID